MGFMAPAPAPCTGGGLFGPYEGPWVLGRGLGKGALRLSAQRRCKLRPGGPGRAGRGAAPADREGGGEARSQRAGRSALGRTQASSYHSAIRESEAQRSL